MGAAFFRGTSPRHHLQTPDNVGVAGAKPSRLLVPLLYTPSITRSLWAAKVSSRGEK